jgi:DNA polymerase III alpha subunit
MQDRGPRRARGEFGQPALGLTDHGVMNGAVELYKACKKHGDQADRRLRDLPRRRPPHSGPGKVERNHLTLLAADDTGYRNLVKLSSLGFLEGLQRGKPTVDWSSSSATVGTGDVHYLRREDYATTTALLCVQTKSTTRRTRS